ncbi:unnamed protein product [Soboliphyme baturini]|uniref:Uncharacterized protein n=1 Tax=Soboliphyme baturini TaxID=241478 RepID=A0A183J6Q9_9BILA|nr:unnamed protein product [Soboliphyme baturini]
MVEPSQAKGMKADSVNNMISCRFFPDQLCTEERFKSILRHQAEFKPFGQEVDSFQRKKSNCHFKSLNLFPEPRILNLVLFFGDNRYKMHPISAELVSLILFDVVARPDD